MFKSQEVIAGRRVTALVCSASAVAVVLTGAEIVLAKALQVALLTSDTAVSPSTAVDIFNFHFSLNLQLCIAAIAIFGVARAGLSFTLNFTAIYCGKAVASRIRQLSVGNLILRRSTPPLSVSQELNFLESIAPRAGQYVFFLCHFIGSCTVTIGLILAMVVSNALLAGIALAAIGILGIGSLALTRKVRAYASITSRPEKLAARAVAQTVRNWMFVRINRSQATEFRRITHLDKEALHQSIKAEFLSAFATALPSAEGVLVLAALLFFRNHFGMGRTAEFVQFVYLLVRAVQGLSGVAGQYAQLAIYKPALVEVQSFLEKQGIREFRAEGGPSDRRPDAAVGDPQTTEDRHEPAPRGVQFEVKNLRLELPDGRTLFEDLNFHITACSQFAIVGSSGTGKSTLLELLLGVRLPTSGKVLVDSVAPEAFFAQHAASLGFVGAESFLIDGTLKENLDYGATRPYAPREYEEALSAAGLGGQALADEGLARNLGDGGSGLSSGEKQRIALARALLRNPKVLVLDEVSANLDLVTENQIAATLQKLKGRCTCIIVTHRQGLICYADQVFDLESRTIKPLTSDFATGIAV